MGDPRSGALRARRFVGQLIYGGTFVVLIPALLVAWGVRMETMVHLPSVHWPLVGAGTVIIGLFLMLAAWRDLWVHGGGLPMNAFPPPSYVCRGVYGWVGHPIYVGFVLVCAGVSLFVGSRAGLWVITPIVTAACVALVMGYEQHDLRRRFGSDRLSSSARRLRLPALSDERPGVWDRVSAYVLVFLPWLVLYEAIGHIHTSDVVSVRFAWERGRPVIEWTEAVYALAYPLALLAPLAIRTRAGLRRFMQAAWVGTGLGMLAYVALPLVAEPLPFEPRTWLGHLLMLERADGLDGRAAVPAFHVFWACMGAAALSKRGRAIAGGAWLLAGAIIVSCFTTGMHAIADLVAGVLLFAIAGTAPRCWALLVAASERIANSWKEWRIGPLRIISHSLFAALAAGTGCAMVLALTGPEYALPLGMVAGSALIGAAIWGQILVGSSTLLRPFGYYGCLIGALLGIAASWRLMPEPLLLLGALAVAAPWVQAIGRLRCLVQGCCHGAVAEHGICYHHPRSRVVRLAGLGERPLYPTPLYSILANVALGLLLARLWRLGVPLTMLTGVYFIGSGLARFVEESYRGEPRTQIIGGMRIYQWCAIAATVLGMGLMLIRTSYFTPPGPWLGWPPLGFGVVAGAVFAFAMGIDFPESNRRFSRLA